ncbi:MAG TPA: ribosome silencing factor [Verrucomicrobiota bacterium]|nr:ribosome silencing factor [Verrucomicrobiota bacterium]HNU51642.1 ribosome silencing factor [Verrucomicrobiota bacterium]
MDSRTLALRCRELAEDKKAEDVVVLDVRRLSSVADYFVIATGSSEPHLRAIMDEIVEKLHEERGEQPHATDGTVETQWVVLDYFDVMVHLMRDGVRQKYDLESLWGDAPRVRARRVTRRSSLGREARTTKPPARRRLRKPASRP